MDTQTRDTGRSLPDPSRGLPSALSMNRSLPDPSRGLPGPNETPVSVAGSLDASLEPASRVALVIDCSGSMAQRDWPPCRLDGATAAAIEFAENRELVVPHAEIAVVAFSDLAVLACSMTPVRRHEDWRNVLA